MVKEILIYIEGDTKQKGNKNSISLRQGFREFFGDFSAISIKLCGGREDTIKIFLNAIAFHPNSFLILLVDSETEFDSEKETRKDFLQKISNKFDFANIEESQCHLMVQAMESWFLADIESLVEFYGQEFNVKSLPQNPKVEKIPKKDVIDGLEKATKNTKKGKYGKGSHSGEILQKIDSKKVIKIAPNCERLFKVISEKLK